MKNNTLKTKIIFSLTNDAHNIKINDKYLLYKYYNIIKKYKIDILSNVKASTWLI